MKQSIHLEKIRRLLFELYGDEQAKNCFESLLTILDQYRSNDVIRKKCRKYNNRPEFAASDALLITYPDTFHERDVPPLQTLLKFMRTYINDAMSGVHILPFFPSSGDGGFSITDFYSVDPKFGTWKDIEAIAEEYRVMSDLVLNHVSVHSEWFQKFLDGDPHYERFFIAYEKNTDTSHVHRPRTHPLLTKFKTKKGERYVWTTFSPEQADLNFKNPAVLQEMIKVLLHYLSHGIELIRLDATAYLWDDPDTDSVNLPQTHTIVKILRSAIEEIAPYALFLSETPFPLKANMSYFGEGDEVNLIYAFHLPPIVLDAFLQKDTKIIQKFFVQNNFNGHCPLFNILSTHDGISVQGVEDFLPPDHMHSMAETLLKHNAYISYKQLDDREIPYEMNITYFDAINDPKDESSDAVERFIASQAVMLALKGMPGIYIHSLIASRNNLEQAKKTGIKRDINRAKYKLQDVEAALQNTDSRRWKCLTAFKNLLQKRAELPQFNPDAHQEILPSGPRLLHIKRTWKDKSIHVLINVSDESVPFPELTGKMDALTEEKFDGQVRARGVYFLKG